MHPAPTGENLEEILREFRGRKGVLLAVLHRVQEAYGYIPKETVAPIGKALGMAAPLVYGSLSFYSEFRTEPPAETEVAMCFGPTCMQRGAGHIRRILEHRLDIDPRKMRSADDKYGVRVLQCPGHCHVAPLMYVNGQNRSGGAVAQAAALADEVKSGAYVGKHGEHE
jgi:NADH:ubiquinone oxidoreductase subunit E